MNDVRIDRKDIKFKYRVCGLIIVNNKLLVVDMDKNNFYCLPGGHVHLNEDSYTAIIREIKEEVGCNVKVSSLLCLSENFFTKKKRFHELGFYYLLEPININELNLNDYVKYENDEGKIKELKFKWIELSKLNTINFMPSFLVNKIMNQDYSFIHTINKED